MKDEPNTMIFKHLGLLKDGVEVYFDESSEWSESLETYFLIDEKGQTKLIAEVEAVGKYEDFFNENFSKALVLIKELSEESGGPSKSIAI